MAVLYYSLIGCGIVLIGMISYCIYMKKTVNRRVKNEVEKVSSDLTKLKVELEFRQNKMQEEKEKQEQELEDLFNEQNDEIVGIIKRLDGEIENKIKDLTRKNTLIFDCVCGETDIPCFISLDKENTFRCPKCNSVYVIQAKFSPVLIGKASSEEEFNKIIENRLKEAANGEREDIF